MADERFARRRALIRDFDISPGAKVLYFLLEDMAGEKGFGWGKFQTLSLECGVSERQISNRLKELVPKWIRLERKRTYYLWRITRPEINFQSRSEINFQSQKRSPIYEPDTLTREDSRNELLHPTGYHTGRELERLRKVANGEWT